MKFPTIVRQSECEGDAWSWSALPCRGRSADGVFRWSRVSWVVLLAFTANGCNALLVQGPGSEDLWSQMRGEVRADNLGGEEMVLVDRTGQPLAAAGGRQEPTSVPLDAAEIGASGRPAESASVDQATAAVATPESDEPQPGAPSPPLSAGRDRISAWSDFDLDLELNSAASAQSPNQPPTQSQRQSQALTGAETSLALPAETAPLAQERRLASGSTGAPPVAPSPAAQGQSFRVQVTDDRPTDPQASRAVWDEAQQAREEAKAEAMFQAVQRVTQQGMSRLSGTGSDATASPALANLLMEQVQGSLSEDQIQQATRALDSWEALDSAPTFDLRGNRPLRLDAAPPLSAPAASGFPPPPAASPTRAAAEGPQAYGPQAYRPASLGSATDSSQSSSPGNEAAGPATQPVGWTDATPVPGGRIPTTDPAAAGEVPSEEHWRMALQKAMVAVERAIPQAGHPQEQQSLEIYLRLLRLLAGDTDQAVGTIESLPKDRQAFWREQLFALSQIVQAPTDEQEALLVNHSRQATKALAHMHNAIQALQNEATLQLRQVQFCQEIRSFGDYDRAKSTLVAAGDPMLIYCEVVNYRSERISDGNGESFQTNMVPSYLIFDDRQRVVSQKEFAVVRDQCRSRRQDFYLVLQLEVPNLPRGKYHVQVSVEDLEGGKIAVSVPLAFQVR